MTKTSGYNIAVGLIVAVGSFTYGFGMYIFFSLSPPSIISSITHPTNPPSP